MIITNLTIKKAASYVDAEDLFHALRAQFKASADVKFDGTYLIAEDKDIEPKQRTHMVMREIWQLTGYRFTCVTLYHVIKQKLILE